MELGGKTLHFQIQCENINISHIRVGFEQVWWNKSQSSILSYQSDGVKKAMRGMMWSVGVRGFHSERVGSPLLVSCIASGLRCCLRCSTGGHLKYDRNQMNFHLFCGHFPEYILCGELSPLWCLADTYCLLSVGHGRGTQWNIPAGQNIATELCSPGSSCQKPV